MNGTERIAEALTGLQKELAQMPDGAERHEVSREEFTLLLSGISICRKVPGIPAHMGYKELYHCTGEEDAALAREHLWNMYGVRDEKTYQEACRREFSGCGQYEHFMTFWVGAPLFDESAMEPEAREWFRSCMGMAKPFYPVVKERGFYAWDINERIGLGRKAVACGLLTEERFWELVDPLVRQAQVFYHSWQEYAVSCLCGAAYFMGRRDASAAESFYRLNEDLVRHLLEENGAWRRNSWYTPKEREWADLMGANPGCLITKCAAKAETVGYMYREEPAEGFPDCGWRFFLGNESDEYVNRTENIVICSFNDICNWDPSVLAYFRAGYGKRYGKTENGWKEE